MSVSNFPTNVESDGDSLAGDLRPVPDSHDLHNGAESPSDVVADHSASNRSSHKPVAMVGAGRLAASVWATHEAGGRCLRTFNGFRIDPQTGLVTQSCSASDIPDLVRLAEVLTLTFVE